MDSEVRPILHSVVLGISWRTADADLRDKFLLPAEKELQILEAVRGAGASEVMVLSTCNRIEIWFAASDPEGVIPSALNVWEQLCGPDSRWRSSVYVHQHGQAVEHVLRVAASVDSLVLGETQIPSQVRDSWERAKKCGHSGVFLGRLLQVALTASKRVRSTTKLAEGALSISSAAVDLAKKIAGDLSRLQIAILGAGEMAELALNGFVRAGAKRFLYLNRTVENAQKLVSIHSGEVLPLDSLNSTLAHCDVLVAATGAPGFVVQYPDVVKAMERRRRPLFLLDIAAPRDIDPRASGVPGVFLYGIDDLEQVVDTNRSKRQGETRAAEQILSEEANAFTAWYRGLNLVPLLTQVRENVHTMAMSEAARFLPRLRNAKDDAEFQSSLEDFAQAMANKFLHAPTTGARKAVAEGREAEIVIALRELFLPRESK